MGVVGFEPSYIGRPPAGFGPDGRVVRVYYESEVSAVLPCDIATEVYFNRNASQDEEMDPNYLPEDHELPTFALQGATKALVDQVGVMGLWR